MAHSVLNICCWWMGCLMPWATLAVAVLDVTVVSTPAPANMVWKILSAFGEQTTFDISNTQKTLTIYQKRPNETPAFIVGRTVTKRDQSA